MAGTVHTEAYKEVIASLVDLRSKAGLSQAALAIRLGKPASFVGKYELGERRLDVVEFLVVLNALDTNAESFWSQTEVKLPERL